MFSSYFFLFCSNHLNPIYDFHLFHKYFLFGISIFRFIVSQWKMIIKLVLQIIITILILILTGYSTSLVLFSIKVTLINKNGVAWLWSNPKLVTQIITRGIVPRYVMILLSLYALSLQDIGVRGYLQLLAFCCSM